MRFRNALTLLMVLLALLFAGPAWAQQKPQAAPGAADEPLDFLQILLLQVDGVSDQSIDALLMQRGTDAHPNQKILDLLRKLGVPERILNSWGAAPVRPNAGDKRARALQESEFAQQDCRAHLRADPDNFLAGIVLVFTLDALDPTGEGRDILEHLEHNLHTRLERSPQNVTLRDQLSAIQELKGMPAAATIARNEAYALGGVRTLIVAGITYASMYNKGFPESIEALAPPTGEGATPTANAAGLIDSALASGMRSGYVFTYSPGAKDTGGRINTYTINADPNTPGTSGRIHYFADQSTVIRQETEKPANKQSPQFENLLSTLTHSPRSIGVQTVAGAEVFLDGSSRGSADATGQIIVPAVALGSHELRVTAPGKHEYRQDITVPELGQDARFIAPLTDLALSPEVTPVYRPPSTEQKPTASLKQVFVQGQLLYAQKRYNEAAGMFEQALPLARERNIPIILFSLGDAWSKAASLETNPPTREQDQARALDCYHKALEADPNNAALHNSLGSLYARLGRLADSTAESKKAVDLDPAQESSYHHIFDQGQSLYAQKHYSEAAGMYEEAVPLARDRNIPIVLMRLADAWSKAASVETDPATQEQDQARALDCYHKALEADPNNAGLHNNLGSLYTSLGRSADAEAEFKKAADLDPAQSSNYYYNMGAILINRGRLDEATTALKKAIDIDPANANAWYWYGIALMDEVPVKPDGTVIPVAGTIEAFQTYVMLAPNGPYAPSARATLDALNGKTDTEYKKEPLPSPDEAVPKRIRVNGQVESAKLIFQPKPEYPHVAEMKRIQGVVRLDAVIGKDGTVEYLKVISGSPFLIKAALDAVQRWRFQPVLLNGYAVQVATEIDVNFTLAE